MLHPVVARLIALTIVVGIVFIVWFIPYIPNTSGSNECDCLKVVFLDVGQGDAILVQTPDGYELLIDGGRDNKVIRELAKGRSFFDKYIDVVVATHPDSDHIGGLIDVFNRYKIDTLITTTNINDTPASAAFTEAVSLESADVIYAESGQQFTLGASTTISIFAPYGDETNWESNNASIILKISYGESDFLLTGDAPAGVEEFIVEKYRDLLQSEVLKLGHHGSKTSTSELFLDTVLPEYAVVSAAIDSPYGHPHQEVMQRVFARDIQTFHTGTEGTVVFESDGKEIYLK